MTSLLIKSKKLPNNIKYELLYFASHNFTRKSDNKSYDFEHYNLVLGIFDKKYLLPLLNSFGSDSRRRALTFCSVRNRTENISIQEFIELLDTHDKTWNHVMLKHEFQTCCHNDDLKVDNLISMMKLCSDDERHKVIDYCLHFLPLFTKFNDLLKLISLDNCDIIFNNDQKLYVVNAINHAEYFKLRMTKNNIEKLIKYVDHSETCEKICSLIGTNKCLMNKYF
jgi:hypothetical protein